MASITVAQNKEQIEFLKYEDLYENITLYKEKEDYVSLHNLLDKIHPSDTIYESALVSKSYYYLQEKKFDEAIAITDKGLEMEEGKNKISFYFNKIEGCFGKKDFEKAKQTTEHSLKEFPYNHELWFKLGRANVELEQYEEAIKAFEKTIAINPFFDKVHLIMGDMYYKQQQTAQAILCYNLYLLNNPDGESSTNVLSYVDSTVRAVNKSEKSPAFSFKTEDDFEEINLIINNRVALNSDYKISNKVNISYVKQLDVLLKQLKGYSSEQDCFMNSKYVQLHQWIMENNLFDEFIYTLTYSIENPKYKKIVQKKTDDVVSFIQKYKAKWISLFIEQSNITENPEQSIYYANGRLNGIGKYKGDLMDGKWTFYDELGKKMSAGSLKDGKMDSDWTWYYDDGAINITAKYVDGELEGEKIHYNQNGTLYADLNYSNGKLDGECLYYNEKGALTTKKNFNKGKLDGDFRNFYDVGEVAIKHKAKYVNEKLNDSLIERSPNGIVIGRVNFIDDKKEGNQKFYYDNGKLKEDKNWKANELEGSYKTYYANGKIEEEGAIVDGYRHGKWNLYYPNGQLQKETIYDNGNINDIQTFYTINGIKEMEYTYKNGLLIAFKIFDRNGNVLVEDRKKGGEFRYKGMSIDGVQTIDGLYNVKGGLEGEWKYYSDNGVLESTSNFKEGIREGEHISYHNNGKIDYKVNYVNDSIHDYYKRFFYTGELSIEGWYKNGKAQQLWKYYYMDGSLKKEGYYIDDKFHGDVIFYSVEGKKSLINKYNHGELIKETQFDIEGNVVNEIDYIKTPTFTAKYNRPGGELRTQVDMVNGVEHGKFIKYYMNGKNHIVGTMFNGSRVGKWMYYYPNGIKKKEENYINGYKDGEEIEYYDNGNVEEKLLYEMGTIQSQTLYNKHTQKITGQINYVDGKVNGKRYFYSNQNEIQLIRFYEMDRLVGYSYLDTNGKELPMIPIVKETAKIVAKYANGKVSREMEYVNGWSQGEYKAYYSDGTLELKCNYIDDEVEGAYEVYYPDGKLEYSRNYKNGQADGIWKEFYKTGKLKSETNYKLGSKTGEQKEYDQTGKLIRTTLYFDGNAYKVK